MVNLYLTCLFTRGQLHLRGMKSSKLFPRHTCRWGEKDGVQHALELESVKGRHRGSCFYLFQKTSASKIQMPANPPKRQQMLGKGSHRQIVKDSQT